MYPIPSIPSQVARAGDWRRPLRHLALVLDVITATYLLILTAVVVTGGFDLGWISATQVAKPVLVLFLLVPVRAAIPGGSGLTDAVSRRLRGVAAAREVLRARLKVPAVARDIIFVLLVTRGAGIIVAFLANLLFPARQIRGFRMPFAREKFFEIFAVWDSGWYFDIARRGYSFREDGQSSIAFFPLYPTLMGALGRLFGGSDAAIWMAGMIISWAALIGGLAALHRFTERLSGSREVARRTIFYIAVFPFSIFFTRVYTEALFLLLSVAAISAAYGRRWWSAGVLGALVTLTRPNGIVIAVPLLCFALGDVGDWRSLGRRLLAFAPMPLALGGFCGFVYWVTGDPFGWLAAQSHWQYSLGHPPWRQLLTLIAMVEKHGVYNYLFTSRLAPFQLLNGIVALMFLAMTPWIFRKLGMALGAYTLVSLLVPLTGSDLQGIGRYATVLFPAFIVVATLGSQRLFEAILVAGSALRALIVSLLVTQYPVF